MQHPQPVPPAVLGGGDHHRAALLWRLPAGRVALSSASVGGGLVRPTWVLNLGVAADYARTDLDAHADELRDAYDLDEAGVLLLTAADVTASRCAEQDGLRTDVTVGLGKPTWAASESDGWSEHTPGTINVVVQLPVALSPGAAVNAVITATEAKTQALHEARVPGTGTASDAVVVVWPDTGPAEPFCGPRSVWGAKLARTVHAAVAASVATKAASAAATAR